MEKRYVKAKELKLRRLLDGFFDYLDKPYAEYVRDVIDIESIPTLGREVNFKVTTQNVILIRYMDDRYTRREVHVSIPNGAMMNTGFEFSFAEFYNAIMKSIQASTDAFEVVQDEHHRFNSSIGEVNEEGILTNDSYYVMNECSSSAYFTIDEDDILTLEANIVTPRAYSKTKVKFLLPQERE